MASLKEIKGRINSVKSTQKITSAMKMVASAKLHRAQAAINSMLPYERKLTEILSAFLGAETEEKRMHSPYTEQREVKRVAIIAFSSNSSLCGAFNSNVAARLASVVESYSELPQEDVLVYPIGKKIAEAARKKGLNVQGDFEDLADKPSFAECNVIAYDLMKQFAEGRIDKVEMVYHHLRTTSTQVLQTETYFPISLEEMKRDVEADKSVGKAVYKEPAVDYIVEPSGEELLATLVPQAIALKLFTALLDSNASEHSARMLAMQVATDNATDLLQDLTLMYNKSRQQAITNELLDIVGGSMK